MEICFDPWSKHGCSLGIKIRNRRLCTHTTLRHTGLDANHMHLCIPPLSQLQAPQYTTLTLSPLKDEDSLPKQREKPWEGTLFKGELPFTNIREYCLDHWHHWFVFSIGPIWKSVVQLVHTFLAETELMLHTAIFFTVHVWLSTTLLY